MKILMIGLGSIGQRHLRNIKRMYGDSFEILAFRTRRLQQVFSDNMQIRDGADLEEEYGLRVFTDLSQALEEKPEIAYVTNITSKHMETAIQCAKAGCHLFIEKPLSHTLEGIEELKKIAQKKELVIFMGFQNRYHVCVQEARQILKDNSIGSVQFVDSEFSERITTMHTYEDYRQTYMARADMGGGPVLNLQIHDLDLLHYLFGEPMGVFSILSKNSRLEINVEDGVSSVYTFSNKNGEQFPAYTHADFLQYPPVHRIKIVGETGRIEMDLNAASIRLIVNGDLVREDAYLEFQRNDMFLAELKDFITCVREKRKSIIDLEQGIISLKMAVAAQMSSSEKKYFPIKEV